MRLLARVSAGRRRRAESDQSSRVSRFFRRHIKPQSHVSHRRLFLSLRFHGVASFKLSLSAMSVIHTSFLVRDTTSNNVRRRPDLGWLSTSANKADHATNTTSSFHSEVVHECTKLTCDQRRSGFDRVRGNVANHCG